MSREPSIKNQNRCEKEHNGFQIILNRGKKVGNFKTMKNFKFFPWSSKNKPWKSFFDFEVDFYQDSQSTFVVATKQSLFNNVFLASLNDFRSKAQKSHFVVGQYNAVAHKKRFGQKLKQTEKRSSWSKNMTWRHQKANGQKFVGDGPLNEPQNSQTKEVQRKNRKKVSSSHSNMRCVCKKKWFNNKQALKSCLTFCPTIYCVNMTSPNQF